MDTQENQVQGEPAKDQTGKYPQITVLFFLALSVLRLNSLCNYLAHPDMRGDSSALSPIFSIFLFVGLAWGIWRQKAWGLLLGLLYLLIFCVAALYDLISHPGYPLFTLFISILSIFAFIDLWRNRHWFQGAGSNPPSLPSGIIGQSINLGMETLEWFFSSLLKVPRRLFFSSSLGCSSAVIACIAGYIFLSVGELGVFPNICLGGAGTAEADLINIMDMAYLMFGLPIVALVTSLIGGIIDRKIGNQLAPSKKKQVLIATGVLVSLLITLGYLFFVNNDLAGANLNC